MWHNDIFTILFMKPTSSFQDRQDMGGQEDVLLILLEMSTKYDADDALRFTMANLTDLDSFRPASMFCYSVKYGLSDWKCQATHTLCRTDVLALNPRDVQLIGTHVYWILVHLRGAIEQHRKYIAYVTPVVSHWTLCISHQTCERAFAFIWSTIARTILHPEDTISIKDILGRVDGVAESGMNRVCFDATMRKLEGSSAICQEEALREQAVKDVLATV